jgi:hypothetical protein
MLRSPVSLAILILFLAQLFVANLPGCGVVFKLTP